MSKTSTMPSDATEPPLDDASPRLWASLQFNDRGLIPAVAVCNATKLVLMQAWMNREAIEQTLATRHVTYYSRSRDRLWRKGETSGNEQRLVELRLDCDGDCLLLLVEQRGVACHTGRRSCFYRRVEAGESLAELANPSLTEVS